MSNIPTGSQATVVANSPFIPRSTGGNGSMMDYLPEASRITQSGGRVVINGSAKNPSIQNLPTAAQLDSLGLEIQYQGPLLPEYQGLTFLRTDGSPITDSIQSIVLIKK